jgi:GWxTD domain-containing protein
VSTRLFGRNVERLAARVTVFDRRGGAWPRSYPFRYRILDDSGQEVIGGRRPVQVAHSAEPVVVRPDSTPLFLGRYTFEIELEEGRSRWRVDRSFEVEESGPPRGREFDRMLEPLAYIASATEIEELKSLEPQDQPRGWDDFWKRRDPTPDTPRNEAMLEFFRRVRYVDQHFQHFGPGWRSDMGRIYIKFGAPDQIDSRPATTQSPQVEIWHYNRPYRRFVFADREGFGRFTLIYPVNE